MNKLLVWVGGVVVVLAALLGFVLTHRVMVFELIAHLMRPHVGPNHPVQWAEGPPVPPKGDRPPNVVLILADDMGYNDITFNGGGIAHGLVPTPNIDSIGHDGVDFVNGYAGNATCAPSRAAIMTGRYPTRFGFEFTPAPLAFEKTVATEPEPGTPYPTTFDAAAAKRVPPLDAQGVPASEITIAEALKARGYHTLQFGKWHLGGAKGMRPEDQGFDESLGFISGASMYLPEHDPDVVNSKQPWDPIDRFLWGNLPYEVQFNGSPMFAPRGYMTDYLTDEAIQAIKANRNRPFFMYFAPNAIHTPLQAKKEDYDALPQIKDHRLRVYGAMARNLDRNVGRILTTLRDEGLDRNTLVIFTSDNGGAGYIGLPDVNKPYRGFKMTFFEGGIHSPFFMRWPGHIPANSRYPYPVAHVDIFATAGGAAGAPMPKDRVMDGVDLLPFVTGARKGRPHEALYWRSGQYEVLLDGDWKLQSSAARHKVWLYDMAKDPTEQHDLSAAMPQKVAELTAKLRAEDAQMAKPLWPSVIRGPIFVDKPSGVPHLRTDEYIDWDN